MIVASDGGGLNASANKKINKDTFDFGLAALEVIATDVDIVLNG